MDEYIKINQDSWNKRTPIHLASDFYDQAAFYAGKSSLKKVEIDLLGSVKGLKVLHLQCHFGQDSISLARMGASVTGVDLSPVAIEKAKELAKHFNVDATFICSDIFEMPEALYGQFDIVFTSYGVMMWLPELDTWGSIIRACLKPTGRFVMVEFHPMVWMFDPSFKSIVDSYFNRKPLVEDIQGSYTDGESNVMHQSVNWNHSLADLFNGLFKQNMKLTHFEEYDFSPYPCFDTYTEIERDKYQIPNLEGKLPLLFSLEAICG